MCNAPWQQKHTFLHDNKPPQHGISMELIKYYAVLCLLQHLPFMCVGYMHANSIQVYFGFVQRNYTLSTISLKYRFPIVHHSWPFCMHKIPNRIPSPFFTHYYIDNHQFSIIKFIIYLLQLFPWPIHLAKIVSVYENKCPTTKY